MDRRKFLLAALGAPVAGASVLEKTTPRNRALGGGPEIILQWIDDPAIQKLRILSKRDRSQRRVQLVIHSRQYTEVTTHRVHGYWGFSPKSSILWTEVTTAPPLLNDPTETVSCWSANNESTINTHSAMRKTLSSFELDHATGNSIYLKIKCPNPAK